MAEWDVCSHRRQWVSLPLWDPTRPQVAHTHRHQMFAVKTLPLNLYFWVKPFNYSSHSSPQSLLEMAVLGCQVALCHSTAVQPCHACCHTCHMYASHVWPTPHQVGFGATSCLHVEVAGLGRCCEERESMKWERKFWCNRETPLTVKRLLKGTGRP